MNERVKVAKVARVAKVAKVAKVVKVAKVARVKVFQVFQNIPGSQLLSDFQTFFPCTSYMELFSKKIL